MLIVIEQLAVLYIFMALGYAFGKIKKSNSEHGGLLSFIIVNLCLPSKIFNSFSKNFTVPYIKENYKLILLGFGLLVLLVAFSFFAAKLLTKNPYERRIYRYSLTISNNAYIGYVLVEEALGLSRARHGTDYGDFTRGNSQQKILIAIKNKVVEKGLGLSEAMAIINAVGDNVRMNLNMSEIKTGMHLLEEFDLDNMRQIALVGDTYYMSTANINGISYVVPSAGVDNYTKLQEYIALKLKNSAAEREGAEILVLNGTGEAGVAAEERAYLEKKGYLVKEIANAPEGEYQYTADIEVYDTSEGKAPDTRKALEKLYSVTAKEEAELPNGISGVGYDFIIIVGGAA